MASLVNMSGGSLLNKVSLLPSGYKQLEYIESTGTQYLDTGIVPTSNTRVIDYAALSSGRSGWGSGNSREVFIWGVNTTNYLVTYGRSWKAIEFPETPIDNNPHRVEISPQVIKVDDTEKAPITVYSKRLDRTLYLFAANVEWGPYVIYYETGKRYSTKIYEGETIVRNFIPCKNPNNVVGMYDTVNGVFYSSSSGTAFIAGPEV